MKTTILVVAAFLSLVPAARPAVSILPVPVNTNALVDTNLLRIHGEALAASLGASAPAWASAFFSNQTALSLSGLSVTPGGAAQMAPYSALPCAGFRIHVPASAPGYASLSGVAIAAWSAGPALVTNVNFAFATSNQPPCSILWATNTPVSISNGPGWIYCPAPACVLTNPGFFFQMITPAPLVFYRSYYGSNYISPLACGVWYTNSSYYTALMADPASASGYPQAMFDLNYTPVLRFYSGLATGVVVSAEFTNAVAAIAGRPAAAVPFLLPPVLYALEGAEFDLYWSGLVHDMAPYAPWVSPLAGLSLQQERAVYSGPPGTYPLQAALFRRENPWAAAASNNCALRVAPATAGAGSNLLWVAIGDSTTAGGEYAAEVARLSYVGTNPSVTPLGSRAGSGVFTEGVPGWTISLFATHQVYEEGDSSNQLSNWKFDGHCRSNVASDLRLYWSLTNLGAVRTVWLSTTPSNASPVAFASVTNDGTAFWEAANNSGLRGSVDIAFSAPDTTADNTIRLNMFSHMGGAFDWGWYCTNNGWSPNICTFLLGINGLTADPAASSNSIRLLGLMTGSIRSNSPACKIGVATLIQPSASEDAFAANYGSSMPRWKYMAAWTAWNQRVLDSFAGQSNIWVVPLHLCYDPAQDMLCGAPAPRSDANTNLLVRQSNGVHPGPAAYVRVGRQIWAWMKNTWL